MTEPDPEPVPPTAAPVPQRPRETQKQTEKGILIWLCFFLFVTHIIGGVFWLAFHYLGEK
ncbi:hypothetical protein [Embleya sp. NBC_00896]|uniref:hypothetical protein n=1 Tax=Embleya sp. NBC_00896 TaxID=2975961 RepID=UPI00386F5970|nr:hypothetical protein OG928_28130 [Embleya sp. NBC_00896]